MTSLQRAVALRNEYVNAATALLRGAPRKETAKGVSNPSFSVDQDASKFLEGDESVVRTNQDGTYMTGNGIAGYVMKDIGQVEMENMFN